MKIHSIHAIALLILVPLAAFGQTGPVPLSNSASAIDRQVVGTDQVETTETRAEQTSLRLDGLFFANAQQQLGDRGGDNKMFSSDYLQLSLRRALGHSALAFRATGSLEPIFSKDSRPALFQTGRDHNGQLLVDALVPQRHLTEVAAILATDLGHSGNVTLYVAPIGVPAFGSTPYRERISAANLVRSPLRPSIQSFSGQATSVITAGVTLGRVTLEGSGFHYAIKGDDVIADSGSINAHAARVRVGLTSNLSLQASIADGSSNNSLLDRRESAGASWARTWGTGGLAWTVSAAQARTSTGEKERAWIAEGRWQFGGNTISGRADSADTTDLFTLIEAPQLAGRSYRIASYTVGYARDLWTRGVVVSLGGEVTYFHAPRSFEPYYGHKPQASIFYVRLAPRRSLLELRRLR